MRAKSFAEARAMDPLGIAIASGGRTLSAIQAELDSAEQWASRGQQGERPKLSPEAIKLLHANRHEKRRAAALDRRRR